MQKSHRSFCRSLLILFAAVCLPSAAFAQDGFRFKPPVTTLHVKAGMAVPSARGDLFDLMTGELTLEREDFAASTFGADVAFAANERVDLIVSLSTTSASRNSESRDWVHEDDLPIEQSTRFRRTPVTLGIKYHLRDRGRMIGNHAWVPNRVVPFVGAGGGLMWYRIEQTGEFVDETTLQIFPEEYVSSGKALTAHVSGGVEYWLSPAWGVSLEGRYQFGTGELSGDFASFNEIDLRGFQLMAGVSIRL